MFQNQHIKLLQQIIQDERAAHAERVADLKEQIAQLKSTHAEEIKRVISDNADLRDELARTRLYLTPGLAGVSAKPDTSGPPAVADVPTGGAWQRVLKRYALEDADAQRAEQAETQRTAQEAAAKENSNGGHGEGWVEAP
jgi:hypothetical protein